MAEREPRSLIPSGLRPERVNELPDVYHRPQAGSGVYSESFVRKPSNQLDKGGAHRSKEWDNPNVNSLRAFDTHPTDNYIQTRNLVVNYNRSVKYKKDVEVDVNHLFRLYADSLDEANLCWKCKHPIKVVKTHVRRPDHIQVERKPGEAAPPLPDMPSRFKKEEPKRRRILSMKDPQNPYGRVQFTGARVHPSKPKNNAVYADVKCHYEIRKNADGTLRYIYVDGSKNEVLRKTKEYRGANGKIRRIAYHAIEFPPFMGAQIEIEVDTTEKTYRVENLQCGCKR